ncbi:hypothetical protein [Nocardioides bruguierae]|uniref:hypothetical protein n=1 Tax=Nocardioides bruguierae TaxID=2945102 RepID=UPI0020219D64|nr:hypothetical protein [Nocardioides bruguierae]MCL8027025.1 hypothetical protein [Nocardioides bruguierae]
MTDADAQAPDELLTLADGLYALGLGEFTAARDALVREHRGTALAAGLKALRKPATAAWVVDLLVRVEGEQVDQVLALGEALREAQAALSGDALRELTKQRRQLVAAVTTTARQRSREHGLRVTEAVAAQVEATLTAAMVDPGCAEAVRSGLLVAPLASTGVEAVDVSAAVALPAALGHRAAPVTGGTDDEGGSPPVLRVVPDPEADAKARREAEDALTEAEAVVSAVEAEHAEAQADVDRLNARAMELAAQLDEVRRRAAELEAAADEADAELEEAEDARDEQTVLLEDAVRERDEARAALDRLG